MKSSLSAEIVLRILILAVLLILSPLTNSRATQEPAGRSYAYLFPERLKKLTEHLQREGIEVNELREDIELDVETRQVGSGDRRETRLFKAGTILVKAKQKSGDKLQELLGSDSKDRAASRELFGRLRKGTDHPVVVLKEYIPVRHGAVRPLKEDREFDKPITFETIYDPKKRVNFDGSPVSGLTWLDDGEHYLQVRDGRLYRVHAANGRSELFFEPDKLADGLKTLPTIDEKTAKSLSNRTSLKMNPARTAVAIDYENDLYYCTLDGKTAVRLTSSPSSEEYASFSPNGEFVAFVRDQNLHVVDVATQTERALTTDGGGLISNGKADWVYFEEIYGRRWQAFWWSPDSSAIAFMQFDDDPVNDFTVVNNATDRQVVEQTRYPRAGEANPHARVGIVSAAGGSARFVELDGYLQGTYLITGLGWMPDGERVYFFVQDRAQTWLDFTTASKQAAESRRLFRETTKAWVDVPDSPRFLSDGSFLILSERTGWRHIYLYDKDGKLDHPLTKGRWEVRGLGHLDEKGGCVYFTGTRNSHIAENLYRVKISGGKVTRLTKMPGSHRASVSPNGKYFIDSWSNSSIPTRAGLYSSDGKLIRTLDTNPVYELDEYRFGEYEQFQIETSDGFLLEASLLKPPDFDSTKKYPVWFTTYGGPHAPTIRDSWSGGMAYDNMLAQMGMLIFHCDPRSASGKGARSTWTAYRQLGVQELKDVEEAIEWLKTKPFVDGGRIGMSGHSYGGFLTAYALTHSKLFAGGIAGAPVTDWRLYDTIYTERYMDTPQNNPDGYDKTSVVKAAKDLHGRLMIVHGGIDDNVHPENTFKFIDALQRADKEFELMIYPRSRHGIGGMHYSRLRVNFIKSVLNLDD